MHWQGRLRQSAARTALEVETLETGGAAACAAAPFASLLLIVAARVSRAAAAVAQHANRRVKG